MSILLFDRVWDVISLSTLKLEKTDAVYAMATTRHVNWWITHSLLNRGKIVRLQPGNPFQICWGSSQLPLYFSEKSLTKLISCQQCSAIQHTFIFNVKL